MDLRKREEKEFHDRLRNVGLKEDQSNYDHLTSNKKYYSITHSSNDFVNNWLRLRCPGKRVLDYCCGNGGTSFFLAKHGAQVTGIDISNTSIENCRKKTTQEGLGKNASFLVMDAENLEFDDNYFDIIFCGGVLHHLDIQKAYFELARVLKPDGEIICNEPLVHNLFIQLYRKMTPHLRTKWETEHILSKKEINLARKYFRKLEIKFFHFATLAAVPFRKTKMFNIILHTLEMLDKVILKMSFLKWQAWQVIFILSEPKKG